MPFDAQKMNTIYNLLKEMVGPQGAFVLYCAEENGEAEETQIRTFGPETRQLGLIDFYVPIHRDTMNANFRARLKKLPQEPD